MIVIKNDEGVYKENSHNPIFVTDANLVELIDPRTGATATTVAQKRNPWVWAYSWAQQWLSPTGLLIAGIGLTAGAHIDASSFAYAANIADNNSWAIGGEIKIDPSNAFNDLRNISQAGGGDVTFRNGRLTAIVSAPMSISAVITEDDLRGKPSWQSAVETSSLPNRIIPRFMSEANLWQAVDGTVVTNADFVTQQNNRKITTNLDLPYIGNGAEQAGKLAAYGLVNAREPFKWSLQLKPQARFIGSNGDCVQLNLPNTGFSAHNIVITKVTYNNDLSIDIEGITETASKHSWALGQTTTPPDYSAISPYDLNNSEKPDTGQWIATAETISANGTTLPIIRVTGSASDFLAAKGIIIRYRQNVVGSNWLDGFYYQRDATQSEIHGVTPNTSYIVGVSYVNINDKESEIRELAAVTTGAMVAGSAASVDWEGVGDKPSNLMVSDLLNINAGFDSYDAATGVPNNWADWTNGSFCSRVSDGMGGYAAQIYSNGGDNVGIQQLINVAAVGQWIALECVVRLDSGTFAGAGLWVDGTPNIITFSTYTDAYGDSVGDGVVGSLYKFSKLFKVTQSPFNIYAMNHYTLNGSIASANKITWFVAGWRYATEAEIQAHKAINDVIAISSDNVLSRGEKPQVQQDWTTIYTEHPNLIATATSLGITTELTTYTSHYVAMSDYLSSLSPWWSDATQDTPIVAETYRTKWVNLYTSKTALLAKIGKNPKLDGIAAGADVTGSNVAAGINGQGNFATANYQRGTSWTGTPTEGCWLVNTSNGYLQLYTAGSWRDVANIGGGGMSATLNNPSVGGDRVGAGSVTSNTTTVSVSGGSGGYGYSWYFISGDSSISLTAAFSATTAFSATVANGQTKTAIFGCLVRDSEGKTATAAVQVQLAAPY